MGHDRSSFLDPYSGDKFGLQDAGFSFDALLKESLVTADTVSKGNCFLVDALFAREAEECSENELILTSLWDKDLEWLLLELPIDDSVYENDESSMPLLEDM